MNTSSSSRLQVTLQAAMLIAAFAAAGDAAAITPNRSSTSPLAPAAGAVVPPAAAASLPKRGDVLTIDWVDAKAGRIGIGGLTYVVRASPVQIVLGNGTEVASVGFLTAGLHARIETTVGGDGMPHLVSVRVVD